MLTLLQPWERHAIFVDPMTADGDPKANAEIFRGYASTHAHDLRPSWRTGSDRLRPWQESYASPLTHLLRARMEEHPAIARVKALGNLTIHFELRRQPGYVRTLRYLVSFSDAFSRDVLRGMHALSQRVSTIAMPGAAGNWAFQRPMLDRMFPDCLCQMTLLASVGERDLIVERIGPIKGQTRHPYPVEDTLAGRRKLSTGDDDEGIAKAAEAQGELGVFCVDLVSRTAVEPCVEHPVKPAPSSKGMSTSKRSDDGASLDAVAGARDCICESGRAGLILGGAHHKTGTVLLERLLALFANRSRIPFHRPKWELCPWIQRREAGVCVDEHLSAMKLARFWGWKGTSGVEPVHGGLFRTPSSGRSGRVSAPAAGALGAALIHVVREPLETCVSAYAYHLNSSEVWLQAPRPSDALIKSGPDAGKSWESVLASYGLAGLGWQEVLRRSDVHQGLRFECRRSIDDQITQQAEVYNATRADARVLTLRMEETELGGFDDAVRRVGHFLRVAYARWPGAAQGVGFNEVRRPNATSWSASDEEDVASFVQAAKQYDLNRNRAALDDGHLSSLRLKRQLRGLLLSDTGGLRTELARWRRAVGYDASYELHCQRYGLAHHEDAIQDGLVERGPGRPHGRGWD